MCKQYLMGRGTHTNHSNTQQLALPHLPPLPLQLCLFLNPPYFPILPNKHLCLLPSEMQFQHQTNLLLHQEKKKKNHWQGRMCSHIFAPSFCLLVCLLAVGHVLGTQSSANPKFGHHACESCQISEQSKKSGDPKVQTVIYTRIFQSRTIPQMKLISWYALTEFPPT